MPVDPGPTRWAMPDVTSLPAGRELAGVGADLEPATLLAGYRSGLFALPEERLLGWWSPDPRGILRPRDVHVSRSLRRSLGRFTVSVDRAFGPVVDLCADPARPHGWITAQYAQSYRRLHALGWAHSVEVWDEEGGLAGGLFGVEVGGLFAAESKGHVRTDASKVAVVALAVLLAADGDPDRVVDVQWPTEHLARLGVVAVPRPRYMAVLQAALRRPPALSDQPVASVLGLAGPASRIRWRTA